jgi:hypothetical protein
MMNFLKVLEGRQLSSVEFVQDYVQLHFDGLTLTAVTLPRVSSRSRLIEWGQPDYRDALCGRIGKLVRSADTLPEKEIAIEFEDDFSLLDRQPHSFDWRALIP